MVVCKSILRTKYSFTSLWMMGAVLVAGCGDSAEPVVDTASAEDLAAKAISAGQVPARGPFTFVCGSDPADVLVAHYYDTTPSAMMANRAGSEVLLFVAPSGSGARYASGTTSFWEHQGEVTWEWGNPPQQVVCTPQS